MFKIIRDWRQYNQDLRDLRRVKSTCIAFVDLLWRLENGLWSDDDAHFLDLSRIDRVIDTCERTVNAIKGRIHG